MKKRRSKPLHRIRTGCGGRWQAAQRSNYPCLPSWSQRVYDRLMAGTSVPGFKKSSTGGSGALPASFNATRCCRFLVPRHHLAESLFGPPAAPEASMMGPKVPSLEAWVRTAASRLCNPEIGASLAIHPPFHQSPRPTAPKTSESSTGSLPVLPCDTHSRQSAVQNSR